METVQHAQEHFTIRANEEHTFDRRKEQGFVLHVPKGAVSSYDCAVEVKSRVVSQPTSEFIFLERSRLVSCVYHITAPRKLSKPVSLQFQHCAIVKGDSKHLLVVAIADSTTGPPYRFKPCTGKNVRAFDKYIEIELAHFCFLCCLLRAIGRASIRYCGLICCLKSSELTRAWEYHIVLIRHLQPCIVVRNIYLASASVQVCEVNRVCCYCAGYQKRI